MPKTSTIAPKRKRRTKAEMQAANEQSTPTFRDIFDVLETTPSKIKKRKRRTKAQIAKDNAKLVEAEEVKYDIPKNNTVYYDKPPPTKNPVKVVSKYPTPKPMPKYDENRLVEVIVMPGGAKYAKSIDGHVMSWNSHKKDWGILYNSQYNDTTKYWSFLERLFKRLNEPLDLILECPKPKRKRKNNVKTNNIRKK
jgi:hypothetical protein